MEKERKDCHIWRLGPFLSVPWSSFSPCVPFIGHSADTASPQNTQLHPKFCSSKGDPENSKKKLGFRETQAWCCLSNGPVLSQGRARFTSGMRGIQREDLVHSTGGQGEQAPGTDVVPAWNSMSWARLLRGLHPADLWGASAPLLLGCRI
jgi:hypothetical protein